jgi:hypothetical protein
VVGRLELVGDRLETDAGLRHHRLIFAQTLEQVTLMRLLLPAPGRLWGHDAALDLGLDAVGTGLLFIAAYLSLLTQDA